MSPPRGLSIEERADRAISRDKLNTVQYPEKLRQAAFRTISNTQDHTPVQLQGITIALLTMCEALNVDVKSLLTSCERMKNDLEGPFTHQIQAIREYARNELSKPRF